MAVVSGADEYVCPEQATGPAEQETDEGRRLGGPCDEGHILAPRSVGRRRARRRPITLTMEPIPGTGGRRRKQWWSG
jgi:hypothetical protein